MTATGLRSSCPVNAPGVTVLCRKISARHANPFLAPLSSRFDELDGQMWLEDVLVPWERVFLTEPSPDPIAAWCFWHQLYAWLAKAEFTLGLALACAHAMGLKEHEPTIEYLMDLVIDVQTVRSCQTAAELDPDVSEAGYCIPGRAHVAAGSIAMQKARQRMAEILRIVPGSSLVVAPSDKDLTSPEVGAGLEESFGGGEYTALQRAALLQLAGDHVASALDGRESAFELHANGGLLAWRARLRRAFPDYNALANGVLRALSLDMPTIDLESLRAAPAAAPTGGAAVGPEARSLIQHGPPRWERKPLAPLVAAREIQKRLRDSHGQGRVSALRGPAQIVSALHFHERRPSRNQLSRLLQLRGRAERIAGAADEKRRHTKVGKVGNAKTAGPPGRMERIGLKQERACQRGLGGEASKPAGHRRSALRGRGAHSRARRAPGERRVALRDPARRPPARALRVDEPGGTANHSGGQRRRARRRPRPRPRAAAPRRCHRLRE